MAVLLVFLSVCALQACTAHRGQKRVLALGLELKIGCEQLFECWESNVRPLEEQPVLITAETLHFRFNQNIFQMYRVLPTSQLLHMILINLCVKF